MRLDSVRSLKASLPADLQRTFASRARRFGLASPAVAAAASTKRVAPSYFLGVTAAGKKNYQLAVRLQDRELEHSEFVDEIRAKAKGEVDVRYVGRIRARAAKWYQGPCRPLMIGSSLGFVSSQFSMAGTLGCFVRTKSSKQLLILSNNHVLSDENRYAIKGHILQHGMLDGGSPTGNRVATHSKFVPLRLNVDNFVDAALARINKGVDADVGTLKGIGKLAGTAKEPLDIGDVVHKVGRTTGVTKGKVSAIELDGVTVEYEMGIVSFDDQYEIEGSGKKSFSDSGDSGSLIVNDEFFGAALLFAGSDHGGSNGKGLTFANPLDAVLKALKVQLVY